MGSEGLKRLNTKGYSPSNALVGFEELLFELLVNVRACEVPIRPIDINRVSSSFSIFEIYIYIYISI